MKTKVGREISVGIESTVYSSRLIDWRVAAHDEWSFW